MEVGRWSYRSSLISTSTGTGTTQPKIMDRLVGKLGSSLNNPARLSGTSLVTSCWSWSLTMRCKMNVLHWARTVGDNSEGLWDDNTKPTPNLRPSLAILSKVRLHMAGALVVSASSPVNLLMKVCASSKTSTVGSSILLIFLYLCAASNTIRAAAASRRRGQIFEIDIKRKRMSDQVLIRTIKETISSNSGTYF